MSVADKITELTTIRSDIRTVLGDKGVAATDHNFADFATDIGSIQSGSSDVLIPPEFPTPDVTVTVT